MSLTLGAGLAFAAAVCLTGQALTIRLATREATSTHVLVVVLLINVAVLTPLAVVVPDGPRLTPTAVVAFVAAGMVGTLLGRAFLYGGIKRIGATRAEPLKASTPLHATILAVLFLGEVVTPLQLVGIVLVVAGVAVVSWDGTARDAAVAGSVDWTGLAFPLLAAFFFAVEPILAKVGFGQGTPVLVGLAVKTISAAAVFFAFLAARGDLPDRDAIAADFRWLVVAGVANTAFLLVYYAALSVSRVSVVVPIMQTSPLLVALAAAAFLQGVERVTVPVVAGSAGVVVGAVLVTLFG
ncbi:MAG: EamA family transporter [Haloarculaceae archaeon]